MRLLIILDAAALRPQPVLEPVERLDNGCAGEPIHLTPVKKSADITQQDHAGVVIMPRFGRKRDGGLSRHVSLTTGIGNGDQWPPIVRLTIAQFRRHFWIESDVAILRP